MQCQRQRQQVSCNSPGSRLTAVSVTAKIVTRNLSAKGSITVPRILDWPKTEPRGLNSGLKIKE